MPATFSRVKIWVAEVLDYSALNAEFDNILNNLGPAGISGYSTNLAQMRTQTDPFPAGSPSLPNSLAGEIERLRFQVQAILGSETTYWYQDPPVSLSQLNETVLEGGLPNSRLDDGPVTVDDMIRALRPDTGANGTAKLDLTLGSLVYYIDGTRYEQLTTVNVTGFSGAPTVNNTALANSASYTAQQSTQWLGEHGTSISIDTIGSEITNVAGKLSGFKIVHAAVTEYFIGTYINDPTLGNIIWKARRGNFFDYQMVRIPRVAISDNDVITLCKVAWLYIGTNGAVTASYNAPSWSEAAPASPDLGDYWFSLDDNNWRTYGPSGWALSNSVLIGQVILDGSNVVGARTTDRFRTYSNRNDVELEVNPLSTTELRQATYGATISVYGNPFRYGFRNTVWSAIEGGGALAASTTYYAYIEDDGTPWLSTVAPHDRRGDLGGFYHPSYAWRSVGYATTTAGSIFSAATVVSLSKSKETKFYRNTFTITRLTSGTGTYYTPPGVTQLEVSLIGAGGGGGGNGGAGGIGGSTVFGNLTGVGGSGGATGVNTGGSGGTTSVGADWTTIYALTGGTGSSPHSTLAGLTGDGGAGGNGYFGGGGGMQVNTGSSAPAGATNTGGGGAGGTTGVGLAGNSGGGAGGFTQAITTTPNILYAYAIGAAGGAGATGGGNAAGAGGSGMIMIKEHYN